MTKTTPQPQVRYASRPSTASTGSAQGDAPPCGSSQRYAFQIVLPVARSSPKSQIVPPSVTGVSKRLPQEVGAARKPTSGVPPLSSSLALRVQIALPPAA